MHRVLMILGLSAAAVPAWGADRVSIDEAFGNTIVSTYPDGRTAELWLAPDGTYTAQGRRHDSSNGRWRIRGDKLCLHRVRPWAPVDYCTPIAQARLDSDWAGKAVTGERISIRLVRGRVENPTPGRRLTSG